MVRSNHTVSPAKGVSGANHQQLSREIDLLENLDIVHITLLVERPHLRGRNETGRASQESDQDRVICFFFTRFIFFCSIL